MNIRKHAHEEEKFFRMRMNIAEKIFKLRTI